MLPETFQDSPMGELVRIRGHDARLGRDYDHVAFVPNELPDTLPLQMSTYKIVTEAERALGRLDAAADRLPNPLLLVRPALRREAVSTSALEGTYTTLSEVLTGEVESESARRAEVREVLNYVHAAELGLASIQHQPLSLGLLSSLQEVLVRGTRGDGPDTGRLRERQVFIGQQSLGIEAARFVPPPPGDQLLAGMQAWEQWVGREDDIPLLVKVALAHYQFETLHPFNDGNGRLGRLVATLQLMRNDALRFPLLNLSPWLEARRDQYQDGLLILSQSGEADAWVSFFCDAVRTQARDAVDRIARILGVREHLMSRLKTSGAKGLILDIVDDLIGYPVLTVSQAARMHNVTYAAANAAFRRLVAIDILQEGTGRSYGRVFTCPPVMREVERL